ncbi:hypothetical protein [Sphingobium sp. UBA5915]|uniref:hypothetical protein n=1 Tax=Sphingobium sp. UBA5915 TaxID=1947530 RepID=UPI0025F8F2D5|nr:hypothetical protein [Sphingobium sp. UBA5915]
MSESDRNGKGQFTKGNRGKAKGTRHKATMACEALLDGQVKQLTQKAVDMALAGDVLAMRICMDRIAPPRKDRHVTFQLPRIDGAGDHPAALASIMSAVAGGALTPAEGQALAAMLAEHRKAIETADIEARLAALEAGHG